MIAQTITAAFFIAEGIRRGQWSALVLGPGHRNLLRSSQAGPACADPAPRRLPRPSTHAREARVVAAVGFDTMKATSPSSANLRQGTTGDWKNDMDMEAWVKFDEVFDARMGRCDHRGASAILSGVGGHLYASARRADSAEGSVPRSGEGCRFGTCG